jgi:hypothetical protein
LLDAEVDIYFSSWLAEIEIIWIMPRSRIWPRGTEVPKKPRRVTPWLRESLVSVTLPIRAYWIRAHNGYWIGYDRISISSGWPLSLASHLYSLYFFLLHFLTFSFRVSHPTFFSSSLSHLFLSCVTSHTFSGVFIKTNSLVKVNTRLGSFMLLHFTISLSACWHLTL